MTTFKKYCQIRGKNLWAQHFCHIKLPFINISLNGAFGNVTVTYKGTEHKINRNSSFLTQLDLSNSRDNAVISAAS